MINFYISLAFKGRRSTEGLFVSETECVIFVLWYTTFRARVPPAIILRNSWVYDIVHSLLPRQ
jgi:hypothetical protein